MSIHSDVGGAESSERFPQGGVSVDWEEFVKLDPEEGLRKAGLTGLALGKILGYTEGYLGLDSDYNSLSDFETAFLLAVAGRGWSQCIEIDLSKYPLNSIQTTALACNLSVNTRIRELLIDGRNLSGTPEIYWLCKIFENNRSITRFEMSNISLKDEEASRCLLSGLQKQALAELVLSFKCPSSVPLAELLSGIPTLKSLKLNGECSISVGDVREAVTNNTTLEILHLQFIACYDMTVFFESLSLNLQEDPRSSECATNTTLKDLLLHVDSSLFLVEDSKVSQAGASLARMMESNKTLKRLYLHNMPFVSKHWIGQIFPALSKNQTLSILSLTDCGGLSGDDVGQALVDSIRESDTNMGIVDIMGTNLRGWQGQVNEELWLGRRRWKLFEEFVKLDPEEGLRKAGLTNLAISEILECANTDCLTVHHLLSDRDFETALLFAIVGRGKSQCKEIYLREPVNSLQTIALVCNLTINTNVEKLTISAGYFSGMPEVSSFSRLFEKNRSVTSLTMTSISMEEEAWQCLCSGLKKGALDSLDCSFESSFKFITCLFDSLSLNLEDDPRSSDSVPKTRLKELVVRMERIESEASEVSRAVTALSRMIKSNVSLIEANFSGMALHAQHWTDQIFPALSKNETLEVLYLFNCDGLFEGEVERALMGLIQEGKTSLKSIFLLGTGLDGKQGQVNEELRINREYRDKLRGENMVTPTSGRIVLCGFEYAGKTTIGSTMKKIVESRDTRTPTPLLSTTGCCGVISWAFETCVTRLNGHAQQRESAEQRRNQQELDRRTRGIDVLNLTKHPNRISIWDFAGQQEYYVLHDYVFPDARNTHFLYVASCWNREDKPITRKELEADFSFWMRFIASNSKPRQVGNTQLPLVQFVLTKKDKLEEDELDLVIQYTDEIVEKLRVEFKDKIDLCKTISTVNAHDDEDVNSLMEMTIEQVMEILKKQKEYKVCKEIRDALDEWSTQNSSNPIMTLEDFKQDIWYSYLLPHRSNNLDIKQYPETILAYLNDTGEVIYPKNLKFIVVNPKWFVNGILGCTIDPIGDGSKLAHYNGFVTRRNLERLLDKAKERTHINQYIGVDLLIELMKYLEICFEEFPGHQDSKLFLPAVFDNKKETTNGNEKLKWLDITETESVYLGCRLECKDKTTTIITPGFFPRLQVHLVNYIRGKNWTSNEDLIVNRTFIYFRYNGNEIYVEHGKLEFVDIMVKSSRTFEQALKFIQEKLIGEIRNFCASTQGCQGVDLVQAVIRPACVEILQPCEVRKPNSVLESDLRASLTEDGGDYQHTWPRLVGATNTNYAVDLLNGPGTYKRPKNFIPGSSSEGKQISSAQKDLPDFYISEEDVSILNKVEGMINVTQLKPFKLHVYCDHVSEGKKCLVSGETRQEGRDIHLEIKEGDGDMKILQSIIQSLGSLLLKVNIDDFISRFFKGSNLPCIYYQKLEHSKLRPEEAKKVLEDYIVSTGRLKDLLNEGDGEKFWRDFKVHKVYYSKPRNKIGWLCDKHFREAYKRGELQTKHQVV